MSELRFIAVKSSSGGRGRLAAVNHQAALLSGVVGGGWGCMQREITHLQRYVEEEEEEMGGRRPESRPSAVKVTCCRR